MTTLWYSYSLRPDLTLDSPEPLQAPYTISWHYGRYLRQQAQALGWDFRYVNLDDTQGYTIGAEDIVIGHPWFTDENTFIQQAFRQSARLKLIVQPFTTLMVGDEALPTLHHLWDTANHLFLITGEYWWDLMDSSDYARYKAKATRLDNIVNPVLHPHSKTQWHKEGKRAALAIGYGGYGAEIKGIDKVAELARIAGFKVVHLGTLKKPLFEHVPQAHTGTGMEFTPDNIAWVCNEVDFFISMGRYDANPTTLLETACWGLLPCCTPTSGYYPDEPFIGLSLEDIGHNLDMLQWIQYAPAAELADCAAEIRERVIAQHNPLLQCATLWQKIEDLLNDLP